MSIFKKDFDMSSQKIRCEWVGVGKLHYEEYHDKEWGVPVHDDNRLFEMLILEGAQAGLSWETVLKKRGYYREVFKNFIPSKVAIMSDQELENILKNSNIIRNRLKVYSTRNNAIIFIQIQKEFHSFNSYVWGFVGGKPINYKRKDKSEVPVTSYESELLSKDLKKRGMKFVGSTIIYAYMQAIGMVNDHSLKCFRHKEILNNNLMEN